MRIVTHDAKFHADDIFAVATLKLVYPDAEVVRSRDREVIESADIVVDVGQVYDPSTKRFDHHQPEGAGKRDNGIPYASFGLVWKEWGREVCGSEEASSIIDGKLVAPIDAHDNGMSVSKSVVSDTKEYTISNFFYAYFYTANQTRDGLYEAFNESVVLATNVLKKEIQIAEREVCEMEKIRKILNEMKDKRIVVLEEDLAWHRILTSLPEPVYVIYPGVEGTWRTKAIQKSPLEYEYRKPLPREWGGKEGKELQDISGVEDAVFCHRGLFVCAAETTEGAIELAKKALEA